MPSDRLQQCDHPGEPHRGGSRPPARPATTRCSGPMARSTTPPLAFTLTGAHTVPPRLCTDCHVNNNYTLNSTAVLLVPPEGLCGHDESGTTRRRASRTHLRAVPRHDRLDGFHLQPQQHGVPADRLAHGAAAVCTDCHVNNNYTTLPTTCIGCHQTDYNNTTNPGHAAQPQFFPTTCQTCHNTTAWTGATFNHTQYTQFPTSHGNANGVCSTCHTNSNDYSVFQCTGCHGGNNSNNFHHDNVSGICLQQHQLLPVSPERPRRRIGTDWHAVARSRRSGNAGFQAAGGAPASVNKNDGSSETSGNLDALAVVCRGAESRGNGDRAEA